MQIQFDPRDRNACAAVLATIEALHGSQFAAMSHAQAPSGTATPVPDAPAINPDAVVISNDAASAFEAPPAPPAVPTGDADDSDDEPATPAVPVTAPGDDADDEQGNAAGAPAATTAPNPPPTGEAAPSNGPNATNGASPSSGVETDTNGLPWDKRIHSGPDDKRPKNADGSWRKRRGVDDETVAQVEAELRQIMGAGGNAANAADGQAQPAPAAAAPTPAPTPPVPTPPVPTPPVPTPPAAGTASGPDVATTADSAPPAPPVAETPTPAPAPTPPAEPAGELTFPALMRQITALQSAGTLTVQGTNDIAVSLGLTSVRDLVHRPDMVASFAALLPEQAS